MRDDAELHAEGRVVGGGVVKDLDAREELVVAHPAEHVRPPANISHA